MPAISPSAPLPGITGAVSDHMISLVAAGVASPLFVTWDHFGAFGRNPDGGFSWVWTACHSAFSVAA